MIQLDLFDARRDRHVIVPLPRHVPEAASDDIPFADVWDHHLTDEQIAVIVAGASNWLAVGQPIKLIGGTPRMVGRLGRIHRLCRVFKSNCYVRLPRVGREHDAKTIMVEIRHLTPIG